VNARPVIGVVWLALAVAGCGEGAPSATGFAVRDSAGIEIVESTAPTWAEGEVWRLSDTPLLEIGVTEGEGPYQLFRVVGATRLSNGSIVVLDAGSYEVRQYDSAGRFVTSAGAEGDGPGEFRMLYMLLKTPGDTILALDFVPQRITVYDANLTLIDVRKPQQPEPVPSSAVFGRLASGALAGVTGGDPQGRAESGPRHSPASYLRLSSTGGCLDTIVETPGWDEYLVELMVLGQVGLARHIPPFGRIPQHSVHADQILVGNGDTYEIRVYGEDGAFRTIIRRVTAQIPVTPEHLERYLAVVLARLRTANSRRRWERVFRDMPVALTLPAFDSLTVDAEGNLWVRHYEIESDLIRQWDVFDRSGSWLGTTATPPRFHVFEVGSDYVLGVWKDDLDVEHVQLYELIKP